MHGAFIAAGLVDRVALFLAPRLLGGGVPIARGADLPLAQALRLGPLSTRTVGDDLLITADVDRAISGTSGCYAADACQDMFTGIVEATGTIQSIARAAPEAATARLTVSTTLDLSNVALGASIAVDGVCLTVVERDAARGLFAADLGPETLMLTTLGGLEPGARVHLERAAAAGRRAGRAPGQRPRRRRRHRGGPSRERRARWIWRSRRPRASRRRWPSRARSRSTASA